ncbi:MAG: peptide chain release factor N(5)-glutamine methyltransferase [Fimbriimonadales bacterium]|nr:peptide chain release factor N(5)-glutamine methyltransferase [Fimbriimonadales bacterium]
MRYDSEREAHIVSAWQTVEGALSWAQVELQNAGIPDARREAEILLAACLNWERARLIAHPEIPLDDRQQRRFACWIRRRARREPLAYITRRAWFYGLKLTVGRGVLIPRPETELLVGVFLEWAAQALTPPAPLSHCVGEGGINSPLPRSGRGAGGEGIPNPTSQRGRGAGGKRIPILVDAGVGSGAIAIACLKNAPEWLGVGIDRSRRALRIAQMNRRTQGLDTRLLLLQGDWLGMLRPHSADAVLSNPPYVLPEEWDTLQPEIVLYEPRTALLVPADDPLQPYRRIAQDARQVLRSHGLLAFETSPRLAPLLAEHLPRWGFPSPHIQRDYSGVERVVYATRE